MARQHFAASVSFVSFGYPIFSPFDQAEPWARCAVAGTLRRIRAQVFFLEDRMDRQTAAHAAKVLWQHLAPLRPYLDNPAIQEVMINHPEDVWVEEQGVMRRLDLQLDSDQVDAVIKILANLNNKPDALILDCRLPGLRVAAARHPIAVRGHSMCIRKHAAQKLSIAYYLDSGAFTPVAQERFVGASGIPAEIAAKLEYGGQSLADFLTWAVRARKNILVSGSTSSGKTTLIGALLDLVQQDDRLIIIEDTGELSELHFDAPNRVHFEPIFLS
jgi:Flp pilus assembly CpaF family ATPase